MKRYKRFLADVQLPNGEVVVAHCPNTGSMKTCGSPGDIIYLSYNPSPKRKLSYTWELTQTKKGFIGINTHRPNKIVEEAILNQQIKSLSGYKQIKREVKYGENSRIDLLLSGPKGLCWVEVKNVTLLDQKSVLFPDAVTSRGLKHLKELKSKVTEGDRSVIFFLINRPEGDSFSPAYHIDPTYSKELVTAQKMGVEVLAYRCCNSLEASTITNEVPLAIKE